MSRWYDAKPETDAQCAAFAETIRAAGRRELQGPLWQGADGALAIVLLTDQLARGAFRGQSEAFAYDAVALETALRAIRDGRDARMQAAELQACIGRGTAGRRLLRMSP